VSLFQTKIRFTIFFLSCRVVVSFGRRQGRDHHHSRRPADPADPLRVDGISLSYSFRLSFYFRREISASISSAHDENEDNKSQPIKSNKKEITIHNPSPVCPAAAAAAGEIRTAFPFFTTTNKRKETLIEAKFFFRESLGLEKNQKINKKENRKGMNRIESGAPRSDSTVNRHDDDYTYHKRKEIII
jgi:hypothetical protein